MSASRSAAGARSPSRHALGGQARGLRLELGADLGDVDDVAGLDLGHVRAAARADLDEPLEREPLDRLAQRRAAEARARPSARPRAARCRAAARSVTMRSRSWMYARSAISPSPRGRRRRRGVDGSRQLIYQFAHDRGNGESTPPDSPSRRAQSSSEPASRAPRWPITSSREGWTDLVIVDQGPLWETGGSTSHAPGLVFQLNPSPAMTKLAQATRALLGSLELDGLPCFHAVGGIEVATTEERWAELARRTAARAASGSTPRCSRPAQVAERIPLHRPRAHHRRPARRRRRHRQGRPRRRGDGARRRRAGRPAGLRRLRGDRSRRRARPRARRGDRARHDPRRHRRAVRGHLGAEGGAARAHRRAARARPAPVRVHRAARAARRRDARGRPPDPAPPGPLDLLPPARGRLRDRQLPPRAAAHRARGDPPAGRRDAAVDAPVHRRALRLRARRGRAAAARARRRADAARVQRPDVVHAGRLPAARRVAAACAGCGSARRSGSPTPAAPAARWPS